MDMPKGAGKNARHGGKLYGLRSGNRCRTTIIGAEPVTYQAAAGALVIITVTHAASAHIRSVGHALQ